MNISIDASKLLASTPTGVEVYCHHIINGLLTKSNNLTLYTPKLIPNISKNNQKILAWPPKFLWSQIRLGFHLLTSHPDIFFSPGYVIPFLALFNKSTKKIVTIHDVAFTHDPQSYSAFQRWLLSLTTRQAVKHAHAIIVPTKTVKQDLIQFFNCPENKIQVTYFGPPQKISNSQSATPKKQILYIGRLEEKKNIPNLIEGFKIFNKKYPDFNLILAGKTGHGYKTIKPTPNISILGYIDNQTKDKLLRESSCLTLVTKYEGFGLPLLEGFNYGIPVLASNIPVLKEIGDSACLFVDPSSPASIAQGLGRITQDNKLRQDLITKSKIRLKDFSWSKCIDQTWHILNQ